MKIKIDLQNTDIKSVLSQLNELGVVWRSGESLLDENAVEFDRIRQLFYYYPDNVCGMSYQDDFFGHEDMIARIETIPNIIQTKLDGDHLNYYIANRFFQ